MKSIPAKRSIAGYSIAESVIALGIGAMAVAGGMSLNQQELRLVKSARESNAASMALEERIEQLRLVNWKQMTDAAYLMANYFPNRPKSGRALPGLTEHVTVSAFPETSACTPLTIERNDNGNSRIVTDGAGLDSQHLAKVTVRVTWRGKDSRMRVRELASIISNAGINRTSLPAMGGYGGTLGESSDSTTTTGGTSSGGTTSDGTTTGGTSSGGTTTTTTTTTSGNGNGNGNGQGNVSGQSGKK